MKLKPLVLLVLALGCGLVAMLGVQQMMAKKEAPVQEETVKVLQALTDIEAGKPLDETNVAFKDVPKDRVPEGAITTSAEYEKRALKKFAYSGDFILTNKLGDVGETGAATSIPMGMRLTTVPITMHGINSGMVRPGDRVDIICTYSTQTKGQQVLRTKTVLEYVEVFAIDRQRAGTDAADSNKGTKYETLTFLCTPKEYLLIQHAKKKGELNMALRKKEDKPEGEATSELSMDDELFERMKTGSGAENPDDEKPAETVSTGAAGLKEALKEHEDDLKNKKIEEPPAADPDQWVIKIYEGGNVREAVVGQPPQPLTKDKTSASNSAPQKKAAPKKPQKPKSPTTQSV